MGGNSDLNHGEKQKHGPQMTRMTRINAEAKAGSGIAFTVDEEY